MVKQLNNMYANSKHGFRVSDEDARFGLMDSREYHKAWLDCYCDTIQPRFLQRGFQSPSLNR